jgi:hypothetical protein
MCSRPLDARTDVLLGSRLRRRRYLLGFADDAVLAAWLLVGLLRILSHGGPSTTTSPNKYESLAWPERPQATT